MAQRKQGSVTLVEGGGLEEMVETGEEDISNEELKVMEQVIVIYLLLRVYEPTENLS